MEYTSTSGSRTTGSVPLVIIGARSDGERELLAVEDGYRESAESWKALLRELKRRGMAAPAVAVGDGALGFWAAAREVWPETRERPAGATARQRVELPRFCGRCWACG